ncbi:MAG: NAD(+)/NADH kinase [Deferribacteres bacterium]|nr:NAD(+)/NADH kinase [candidate division KSB1 bacterium]MCB9509265.1 NAD(+)/NADH kinase [Deferribacteres bacterium]
MRMSFLGNPTKPGIQKYLSGWVDFLLQKSHVVSLTEELAALVRDDLHANIRICSDYTRLLKQCDLAISLGGDGTILLTAKYIADSGIPILGVKFGGLGFLADVSPDEFYEAIQEVEDQSENRQERLVLSGWRKERPEKTYHALNEFVMSRQIGTQSSRIGLWVNGTPVSSFIADGLIISSPTGSTAYSMAAGGPLVSPVIDVLIITPICAHSLTTRPIVVRDSACIWIEAQINSGEELSVNADGEHLMWLKKGEIFQVQKADYSITLLQRGGHTFFDILKKKLHWGEDIRKSNESR